MAIDYKSIINRQSAEMEDLRMQLKIALAENRKLKELVQRPNRPQQIDSHSAITRIGRTAPLPGMNPRAAQEYRGS